MTDPLFDACVTIPRERRFLHGKPEPGSLLADCIGSSTAHTHLCQIYVSQDHLRMCGNLIMLGHHPSDIADAIKRFVAFPGPGSNFWHNCLTKSQLFGILKYRNLRARPAQDPEDVEVLMQYYNTFDDLFFFGALRNLCTVRIVQKFPKATTLGQCISHFTGDCERIPRQSACLIELLDLQTEGVYDEQDNSRRLFNYIQTLLHEMLHAFFAIYSCRCQQCFDDNIRLVGEGGHQSSWQTAASAIEAATEKMLEESLDMNRARSLAHDWFDYGETYPRLLDYPAWHMTRREVIKIFKGIKRTPSNPGKFVGKYTPGMYTGLDDEEDAEDFTIEGEDEDYEADTDPSSSEDYDEMESICTEDLYD